MRLPPLLTVLAAAATFSALATSQAGAQVRPVHIVQTDCDTISLDPPLVRVSFGVINFGPTPVCSIHLVPIQSGATPADSCRILECSSAPGWQCSLDIKTPGANWFTGPDTPPGCIQLGEKHEPFDIVLDPLFCCYRVEYDTITETGERFIFFTDEVCFECQKPVPTLKGTWGSLKASYR